MRYIKTYSRTESHACVIVCDKYELCSAIKQLLLFATITTIDKILPIILKEINGSVYIASIRYIDNIMIRRALEREFVFQ